MSLHSDFSRPGSTTPPHKKCHHQKQEERHKGALAGVMGPSREGSWASSLGKSELQ